MKIAALGLVLSLVASAAFAAQPVTIVDPANGSSATVTNGALNVAGSFSATLAGFTPNGSYGTPLSVSNSSSETALPTGAVVAVYNVGSSVAYINLGTSGSVTATTSDIAIPAGGGCTVTVGSNTNIAAITASSTTTLNTAGGAGLGNHCWGGGSGGAGSSGAVYGPTAQGSPSANPPVQIGGTVDGTATGTIQNAEINSSHQLIIDCAAGCAGGSTSNASSGVATSSTNGATVSYNYGFNGTTWDQLQVDGSKYLKTNATNLPTTVDTNTGAAGASTIRTVEASGQVFTIASQPQPFLTSASFTRPANTTAYALGQLVANSTSAGSVVPMSFTLAKSNNGLGHIVWVKILASSTSVTNAQFRIHFYSASPTIANGDGAAWSTTSLSSGSPIYLGSADVTVSKQFSDGAEGEGYPTVNTAIPFQAGASSQVIYALIEARGAYTPTNGETIQVVVGGDAE